MDQILSTVVNHPLVQYGTQAQIDAGMWGTSPVITDYVNAYVSEYTISFAYMPYIIMMAYFVSLYIFLILFAVVYQMWWCVYYAAAAGNSKNSSWCQINANTVTDDPL